MIVASSPNLIGGAEHCLVDIASRLRTETGWDPLVVVPAEGTVAKAVRDAGGEVAVVDVGVLRHRGEARSPVLLVRLATAAVAGRRLARLARERGVEVIHTNAASVVAGALAARWARLPHVWHVREILGGPAWRLLRRAMRSYADRIVCISACVADHVRAEPGAGRRVTVIRDGIDLAVFHPGDRHASGEVLMLSRVHPEKGHAELLRAAAAVCAREPSAHFSLVGGCIGAYDGLRRQLEALIDELGLRGRAELLPDVSREQAAELLRAADVAVVPSTWTEPGGLVVLEGMACGTPVVAPPTGGPAEVVDDGVDGFLVDPTDTDALADAIGRLLADAALRADVGDRASRRAREEFGLDVHVRALAELYDELAGRPLAPCA
jgi:glycosyltransferase involved in cell wall biosynthesis